MKKPHTPLLLRITSGRIPSFLVGILVAALTILITTVVFEVDGILKNWNNYWNQTGFYALSFGYLVYISRIIHKAHQGQFEQLLGNAKLTDSARNAFIEEFKNHRKIWVETLIAAFVGMVQAYFGLIRFVIDETAKFPYLNIWKSILLILLWVVITQSISIYTRNMVIMNKVSKHIEIDLLKLQQLMPLTKAGIVSILAFIGVYTILFSFAFNVSDLTTNPAMFVLVPTIVIMIYRPLKGVRKRIIKAKEDEVKLIEEAIDGNIGALEASRIGNNLKNINVIDLINYKKIIENTIELPVNIPTASRFIFYLIIPLLTWIAASMVDKVIDYLIK